MYNQDENSDPMFERKQKVAYADEAKPTGLSPMAQEQRSALGNMMGGASADPNGLFQVLSQRMMPQMGPMAGVPLTKEASQPSGFLPPGFIGPRIDNGGMGMPTNGDTGAMQPEAPPTWGMPGGFGGAVGRGMLGGFGGGIRQENPLQAQLSQVFRKNAY